MIELVHIILYHSVILFVNLGEFSMVFSSIGFLFAFLPALLLCYFIVPHRFCKARNIILLLFSLAFYACAGFRTFPLILFSAFLDYIVGRMISRHKYAKCWLVFGLGVHLLILLWFKYALFAVDSLNLLGLGLSIPEIVLPVGISFFTFQGMSYLIDVYREDIPVERSLLHLCLYVTLFPQLIAGPIVRYSDLSAEITQRVESIDEVVKGSSRFILGLGKKVILANTLAQISDASFNLAPENLSIALAWLGLIAYAGHIYFDFSGYSDMAIGLGRIFGFHFLENFNYPYIARSITDFWRRWHISLSSWFRDYLYIPLGGSRKGSIHLFLNLAIVWTITGLWHGAAWTYLLWGAHFAMLLIGEKFLWQNQLRRLPNIFQHGYTLFFVLLSWVWFRAPDVVSGVSYMKVLFGLGNNSWWEPQIIYWVRQSWPELLVGILACTPILTVIKKWIPNQYGWMMPLQRLTIYLIGVLSVARLLSSDFNPFIYFQF